eukprot:4743913-Pyramimonas_sp.AAC.1
MSFFGHGADPLQFRAHHAAMREQILANPREWRAGDIMWAQHGVLRPSDEDIEAWERANRNPYDVDDDDMNAGGDEYGLDSDEDSDRGGGGDDDTGGGHEMAVDGESQGIAMDDSEVHGGDGPDEGDRRVLAQERYAGVLACTRCGVYEAFAGHTDESCSRKFG